MMGLAFVSNGVALLDIGHNLNKGCRKGCRKTCKRGNKKPFVDTWFFNIASNQAVSSTIFMLGLIFSTILPMINVICFIYFGVRYFIFKYHFVFVYLQDF